VTEILQTTNIITIRANSRMSGTDMETEYHDAIQEVACSLLSAYKQSNLLSAQHS